MNNFNLSADSLNNESLTENLRDQLKQKQAALEDKEKIISCLREQIQDLQADNETLENSEQLLRQQLDRFKKEAEEKDQELEAVSGALKELETAHDNVQKRLDGRTSQVQKYVEELSKTKKELSTLQGVIEELRNKNELLSVQIESINSKKRNVRDRDEEDQILAQEINNLKAEISQLKNQNANLLKESRAQFKPRIHLPPAEEVGEVMDFKSIDSSLRLDDDRQPQQQPIESPKREPLVESCNKRTALSNSASKFNQQNVNNYIANHRIQKSLFMETDPIQELKMRQERAKELARRNMKTKPLHQTSYPLELDTFDTTELTENDIKRGNVRRQALADSSKSRKSNLNLDINQYDKRAHLHDESLESKLMKQAQQTNYNPKVNSYNSKMTENDIYRENLRRQALENYNRLRSKPVKKAEAFIV